MKICIISSNYPTEKRIGGFGAMTKKLAVSLSKKGLDVTVIIPRVTVNEKILKKDEVKVVGLTYKEMFSLDSYRKIDADVYHSQNPNLMTLMAFIAQKDKVHVVTARDPRDGKDWISEFIHSTFKRKLKMPLTYLFEGSYFISWIMKRVDLVGTPAQFLRDKAMKVYGLKKRPILMPNLENTASKYPKKSSKPTVCFIGRLDPIKNPERMVELARNLPHVRFIVAGCAAEERQQMWIKGMMDILPNIDYRGMVNMFKGTEFTDILDQSWIMVNTSHKEALPDTFLESAGRGCAILTRLNPDKFATRFGYLAKDGNFEAGLTHLLKNNMWRKRGKAGYHYVHSIYRTEAAVKKHIDTYRQLLEMKR